MRIKIFRIILAGSALILTGSAPIFTGVSLVLAGQDAVFLQTVMTLSNFNKNIFPIYKRKQGPGGGMYGSYTMIPSIQVYDPSGNLIYYGKEGFENASFLRRFPVSAQGLGTTTGLFQRDELFEEVPEFANAKSQIESDHHYLIFALTLSGSNRFCVPQDNAIKDLVQKRTAIGVDVLQVALDMKK